MDTVSLLSEISILKRYIEWLETSLASYEPDWICDKMGDKDLCHDWCYANCGTEAWTHDCFKKYYDNFVADRKTEPQNTCDTCIHKDNPWYMTDCDGCTNAQSNYVRKDELTESEYADAYNRGFASAVAMMADRKTENSSEKPNNCTDCECTDDCTERQEAEHDCKTEPQTHTINPKEPTNMPKCFDCEDFFTCDGQCDKVECEKCKHFIEEAVMYTHQCEFYFMECRFEPKDEPQTERSEND